MKTSFLYISIAAFWLLSCETEIDMNVNNNERKIVINSLLYADSTLVVGVTRSQYSLELDCMIFIDNAEVLVYENGELFEKLENYAVYDSVYTYGYYDSYGHYSSYGQYSSYGPSGYYEKKKLTKINKYNFFGKKRIGNIANNYKIVVNAPNFQSAESSISMPQKVEIEKIDTSLRLVYDEWYGNQFVTDISVQFTDPLDQKNYYFITFQEYSPYWNSINDSIMKTYTYYNKPKIDSLAQLFSSQGYMHSNDLAIEVVYDYNFRTVSHSGLFDGGSTVGGSGYIFSDDLINGRKYEFKFYKYGIYNNSFELPENITIIKNKIYIQLYSISVDYYKYIKSLAKRNYSGGDFMSEKVSVYSNILNGFGMFGAAICSADSIEFESVVYENPNPNLTYPKE